MTSQQRLCCRRVAQGERPSPAGRVEALKDKQAPQVGRAGAAPESTKVSGAGAQRVNA